MAETKNYVSKYSGDQLDAAIAVLEVWDLSSRKRFQDFIRQFHTRMDELEKIWGDEDNAKLL